MSWLSRNRTPVLVLIAAAVLFGIARLAMYTSEGAVRARERDARLAAAEESGPTEEGPSLEVSTVVVDRAPAADVVELAGVLEAVRATWVSSELAGRIVAVPAAEHAPIDKGGVLARLDPALPKAEVIRAEASHALAKQEYARQQRLGKRSVASEAELDRARAEERRSYAALLEARTRLGHTEISAPFPGLVNSLDLDPGTYVQPGTRIAEVLDVSTVEVEVPVSDRQIGAIAVGHAARVRVDALGNRVVDGRVVRVGRAPQAETQRYPVVVALDNADGALLPGMLAYVRLEVGNAAAIRVPSVAVTREFELDFVYVVGAGEPADAVQRRRVATRPVAFRPDLVQVESGLEPGERLVISGVTQLREGLRVIVR